ncbi:MAG: hypothetical protein ABIH41_02050 [Nanoarchaeota archaeon]
MKCKKKGVTMNDPMIHQTPRGGFMAKGKCGKCATTLCAMMSKETADAALKSGEAKKGAALKPKKK